MTWITRKISASVLILALCEIQKEDEKKKPPYCGQELGNDPTKCPGEGFEWIRMGKKMKELIKHNLDFDKVYPFFVDQIDSKKSLSTEITQKINFKKGTFFTFLPKDAHIENLYNFKVGNIIPKESINGETFIITVDRECSAIIKNFISKKENLAIFEDYFANPRDLYEIEGTQLACSEDGSVYYFLNYLTPVDSVYAALRGTSHVWLFLGVLASNVKYKKNLTTGDISMICSNIQYIITSAYDGEGYIFWENLSSK